MAKRSAVVALLDRRSGVDFIQFGSVVSRTVRSTDGNGPHMARTERDERAVLLNKYSAFHECKADAAGALLTMAHEREADDFKRMLSIDMGQETHSENGGTRR